jgi:hypothetical protein
MAAAAALSLGAAGCASHGEVDSRPRPAAVADAGQGWQLVLESGPSLAIAERPEALRRDGSLNVVTSADRLAFERAAQLTRPTLERRRQIFLDDDPERPVFFLTPRPRRFR